MRNGFPFKRRLKVRQVKGGVFRTMFLAATLVGTFVLIVLIVDVLRDGAGWLDWQFLTSYPSRRPEEAGLLSALFGTLWVMAFTALLSFPVGIGTAIYLEEYAPDNRLRRLIQTNINNLAGVPSIVYGLLGLSLFVQALALGRSVLAGAMTLTLMSLPVIIIAAQEAIRSVPESHRLGAFALGATRWQVVRNIVLPSALPGVLTGTILAMSRAIGEAAPMIAISALVYLTFIPTNPMDRFTVLPIQIFNWVSRPQEDFQHLAAAGIIVLLIVLLGMNAAAIILRNRYQQRTEE
ncbi:MAG: phosphate ABC transporter, permease protein PstA [Chloroflexi bacterium RBG_16_57_8]|nr:MAG: phosphate ABC transporter, permease protein PstA [Chloroflexi bacterium RBG_16_57_8]